jgi:hypothetical protein
MTQMDLKTFSRKGMRIAAVSLRVGEDLVSRIDDAPVAPIVSQTGWSAASIVSESSDLREVASSQHTLILE